MIFNDDTKKIRDFIFLLELKTDGAIFGVNIFLMPLKIISNSNLHLIATKRTVF